MKKIILILTTLIFSHFYSYTQSCGNMGFESGNTSGWTCRTGSYGSTNPATCGPGDGPTIWSGSSCLNPGGINAPSGNAGDRHVIMTQSGADPNSNSTVTYVAPGNMFPSGVNTTSFRLGNAVAGGNGANPALALAESIEYSFLVTQQNAGFTYMYSVFLMDPSHKAWESPRFEIRITRKVNGKDSLIDCGKFKVIAGVGTGAWKTGATDPTTQAPWKYTDWTKVGLDLTGFIGQTVTIQFITSDCFPASGTSCTNNVCTCSGLAPGSHSAYAYIDMYCVPLQIDAPTICANQNNLQICAPPGYQTYSWPAGQPGISGSPTTQCVTINNPIPGTTYTVNMTSVAGGCPASTTVTLKGFDFTVKDSTVCPGAAPFKIDLVPSVTGNFTYTWSPATGLSCTTCEDPIVTPNSTQTYTVTMKDPSLSACAKSKTVKITVNPTPVITIANATICKGAKATLNANGASTYSWSPATGLNTTTGASVSASPTTDQTYIVKGTSAAGCTGSTQVNVKVNNCLAVATNDTTICIGRCAILKATASSGTAPYTYTWSGGTPNLGSVCPTTTTVYTVTVADVNNNTASDILTVTIENLPTPIVSPASVCSGVCANLNATGAVTYSWSPSTGLNVTTGANVSACNLTANQTYTVTGKTTFGCTNTTTVTVTVNPLPTLASNPASICKGSATTLSVTGANTYTWSPATGLTPTTGASVTASPGTTTNYTILGTDSKGCTGSTTVTVTVNPMPTIAVSSATICKGSPSPLTASGADTYSWSPAIGLSATTGATVNASPPSDQSYVVIASTNAGCTGSASVSVKVNNCMFVKANDTTICLGQCAVLKSTASVGVAPFTYSWNSGYSQDQVVCPTTTTDYTVTATDVNGNTASDILTVTIQTTPTLVAPSVSTCFGTCATLTVSGASTYSWSPNTGLNVVTGNSVKACNLTADQTYLIIGATSAGCTNTLNVSVTINPLPTLSSNPAIICKGVPATLSVIGANTYTWSPSTGLNQTTGNTVIASPTVTTIYTITGKDQNGCTNTTTTSVLVNLPPNISGNSPSICVNGSAILNANGANTYTWSPAATLSSSIGSSVVATPSSSTIYMIVGTDNNGCTGSTLVRVSVDPTPTLTTSNATICIGLNTTLSISGASTYSWTPSVGITPTVGSSVIASPSVTTTYFITGTSAAGCTQTTSLTVTVNNQPLIRASGDTICAQSTATLTAQGGVKYTWEPGSLSGTPVYTSPNTTTTYTVMGEDANGCTNTATAMILVKPLPIADFIPDPQTVSIEAPTINFYNKSINGKIYNWDFGDGTKDTLFHTKHIYEEPGRYNVCLDVANNGCYSKICKEIIITPEWTFYVPNAFSPNGDGLNDFFIGVGTNILEYEMWIFDRWGKMIYHCTQMDKPWNGRVENNLSNDVAQEDVYVWKIKIKDVFEKKHVYVGHVTIVR